MIDIVVTAGVSVRFPLRPTCIGRPHRMNGLVDVKHSANPDADGRRTVIGRRVTVIARWRVGDTAAQAGDQSEGDEKACHRFACVWNIDQGIYENARDAVTDEPDPAGSIY